MKMINWRSRAGAFAMAACLMVGCEESVETTRGSFKLALDVPESSTGRSDLSEIKAVFITVENEAGELAFEEKIQLLRFNHHFITETIVLPTGDFNVTRFLVLNESDETIYATPTEGSSLAELVDNPLPVQFSVGGDQVTSVQMEVVSTEGQDPSDFGYAKFTFGIFNPCDEVTAVVDGSSWCGFGNYIIAYGNTPPVLELLFKNQKAMMGIRLRYQGLGEYDLAGTDSDYYSHGTKDVYDVVSGKLILTHIPSPTNSEISGTFNMILKKPDGAQVEIKEGKFTYVPGMGY